MSGSSPVWIPPLLVSVGLGLVFTQAHAADRVRVALAETVSRVTVTAAAGLRLVPSSDNRIAVSSAVTIVRRGNALAVNTKPVRNNRIVIRGNDGALEVVVHAEGSEPRHWVVGGGLEISVRGAHLLVVNRVDLEEYVAGVVSAEVSPRWHGEVLKTQAVAARTYVLYKTLVSASRPFDVRAGVLDQVYTGRRNVNDAVRDAVEATRGEVVTHEGRPVFAVYSSTAAGPTEDAMNVWAKDVPYLKGVECPFDRDAPRYRWRTAIPVDLVESRFRKAGYSIGWLATLAPFSMTNAGRVNEVRILHSKGALTVTGQELRRILGYAAVFSTRFAVERIGREVVFAGQGAGHGVGLCQWGAKTMAELGYPYRAILRYYYPGTEIRPRGRVIMRLPS